MRETTEVEMIIHVETPEALLLKSPSGNNFLHMHKASKRYSFGLTYFAAETNVIINKACVGNYGTGEDMEERMAEEEAKNAKAKKK